MAKPKPDAPARPRNGIGVELADDGRPVFIDATGESRRQYLARIGAAAEAEERARLAADAAVYKAELAAKQSATEPPTPTNPSDKE